MQIKNNYDIFWERWNENNEESEVNKCNENKVNVTYETGKGVFNGEIGKIIQIDQKQKNIKIKFDDEKICWYEFSELDQIELSYAITIHKAQGSEFDVVVMVIPPTSPILLTRNLLYTGITRAKQLLIIISKGQVIEYMIKNVDSKKRNTGLEYKIKNVK